MALAFARLAAIAAATLLFLVGATDKAGRAAARAGFGHAFSSCFLARVSKDSRMTLPCSGQTSLNTQKVARPVSLTAGLASDRAFLTVFPRISSAPLDSMVCFERWPCTSMYCLTCPIANARAGAVFSWKVCQNRAGNNRGFPDVCVMMDATAA
jgi:hypothetical protein